MLRLLFLLFLLVSRATVDIKAWGFYAHQKINYYAVFSLPPEMIVFYKNHLNYISTHAVDPDKRRYLIKEEPARHYIDLDNYHDSIRFNMPLFWHQAVKIFGDDSLKKHGIVPWHVYLMKVRLTEAFKKGNSEEILKLSADIGHYIADAHVPLHTTKNYNGQFTGQVGIHGLWESRIPEVFGENYAPWVGKANYIDHPQREIWNAVYASHRCLKEVFEFELEATALIPEDRKFTYEDRNGQNVRVYSKEFIKIYNQKLQGQIESRFVQAVKTLGSFWFTAWVDAGQPDLSKLSLLNTEEKVNEDIEKKKATQTMDCSQYYH